MKITDDMLTELLPCPFCGCTKVPNRQGNGIGDYWLECFECGASTRLREDGAGMEKDWNRRPAQPEPRAGVAEEQPSLTNPLTPYGMIVRALRAVTGTLLYDMAQCLLLPSAKVSAMEFGREPVTPEIVREVATYFESLGLPNMRPALEFALDAARSGGQS